MSAVIDQILESMSEEEYRKLQKKWRQKWTSLLEESIPAKLRNFCTPQENAIGLLMSNFMRCIVAYTDQVADFDNYIFDTLVWEFSRSKYFTPEKLRQLAKEVELKKVADGIGGKLEGKVDVEGGYFSAANLAYQIGRILKKKEKIDETNKMDLEDSENSSEQ